MAKKSIEQNLVKVSKAELINPVCIEISGSATDTSSRSRRNKAGSIERTDKYTNIEDGLIPYNFGRGGNFNIREIIILCQKAYYNFSIFKNVLDLMTEFSINEIQLKKGNAKTRDFFTAYFDRINLWSLQDRFFREFYRSGNVFLYRMMAKIDEAFKNSITQVFGKDAKVKSNYTIPLEFKVLNPADIEAGGALTFDSATYYKILTPYEVERLRLRQTDEAKLMYESLDPETKKQVDTKGNITVLLKLDPKDIAIIFNKKQDYEPFAVPMGYPVLEDINYKAELKKMDMALTRTMQQMILLITIGYEGKDGSYNVNQAQVAAIQNLFTNQSIGRVLVADFTTKAEFVVPKIADILDPKKYDIVNQDIKEGLNYILSGNDEKFANKSMNIKVFIQRLKQARQSFLKDFLIPEIKSIAKELNFKNYPTPYFEDIDFKDELEYLKAYTQLFSLGGLTAEEVFNAAETGKLPSEEESIESQKKFKVLKDDGYYEPIVGGPATQKDVLKETNKNAVKMQDTQLTHDDKQNTKQRKHEAENPIVPPPSIHIQAPTKTVKPPGGRPTGKGKPLSKPRKSTPIGGSIEGDETEEIEQLYSLSKLMENMTKASELTIEVQKSLLKKLKLKKLSPEQSKMSEELVAVIIANEEPIDWIKNKDIYLEKPVDTNLDRVSDIQDIAFEYQIDSFLASLLLVSKK